MKRYKNRRWAQNAGPGKKLLGKNAGTASAQNRGPWSAAVTYAQIDVYPGYHLFLISDVESKEMLESAIGASPCTDPIIPKLARLVAQRGAPRSVRLEIDSPLHTEGLLAWCHSAGVELCLPTIAEAAHRSSDERVLS